MQHDRVALRLVIERITTARSSLGICGSRGLVLVLCAHVSRSVHLSGKASGGTVEGPLPSPRLRELLEGFSRMAKSLARLILCPALHP